MKIKVPLAFDSHCHMDSKQRIGLNISNILADCSFGPSVLIQVIALFTYMDWFTNQISSKCNQYVIDMLIIVKKVVNICQKQHQQPIPGVTRFKNQ